MPSRDKPMLNGCLVGITGGYGSGKSAVAALAAERHPVLSSDAIAKEIIAKDRIVQGELRNAFGAGIIPPRGAIDRAALAEVVFSNPFRLQQLNAIVHPAAIARITAAASALFASGNPIVYVESALIFEAGIQDLFRYIIAVVTERKTVLARLEKSGLPRDLILKRLRNQIEPGDKADRADFLIRNDGSPEELRTSFQFIQSLIETLCAKA